MHLPSQLIDETYLEIAWGILFLPLGPYVLLLHLKAVHCLEYSHTAQNLHLHFYYLS